MKAWTVPFALCVWSAAARAEATEEAVPPRCQLDRVIQALAPRPSKIVVFCEPCGDQAPGAPELVDTVGIARVDRDGIHINGRAIDLDYTYAQTSPRHYANLAALAGCPVTGVSPSLRVEDETPNGVLIVADSTPVPRSSATPIVIVQPPTVLVVTATTNPLGWLEIVLACCGTSALLGLGTLAVGRRRRALEPRAAKLLDG